MSDDDLRVIRVLLHYIEDGDRRKIRAGSNNAPTGGGARDLRFSPEPAFWPFFRDVFPDRRVRRRSGNKEIEILLGTVCWQEGGEERSATLEVWPPTEARPREVRITKISRLGLYDLIQDDPTGGRSVFMLFQQKNGVIRLYFTTETSLRNDAWDPTIKEFAVDWFRSGKKAAFIDLQLSTKYPDE